MSSHVPFDIQEEIIKTLPVKSLIRFRSVCKAWKSLINCSEFIVAYSVRHTQPQKLLVRYKAGDRQKNELKYVSFVDDDTFPQQKFALTVPRLLKILDANIITIIGSSHGLLCYCYREQQENAMVVFWNPSIRKAIGVAIPNVLKEPFSSVLGFGVCPHTGDPKVVKVIYNSAWMKTEGISYSPWQVMVFSLSTKKWTVPCNNLPRKSIAFTRSQTVIGQFIYWLALDRIVKDGRFWDNNLIMSFDMSTEEFREVNLPNYLAHLRFVDLSVSRLRGSLALLEYADDIAGREVCVWMMEDGDRKLFTRLYYVLSPRAAAIQRTLGFRKSGEPIIDMILDGYGSTLAVYTPFSRYYMDLGIYASESSYYVNSYTESLLLLNEEDDSIYYI